MRWKGRNDCSPCFFTFLINAIPNDKITGYDSP